MKKLLIVASLAGLLVAQQCIAFTVNVYTTGGYFNDGGGEFTVTDPPSDPFQQIYQNYAPVATVGGGFETFCISTAIDLQSNPLDATLDPTGVSVGTAYLYTMFATGTLPYNYNGFNLPFSDPNSRAASAWQLQNAIWELQGIPPFDPVAGTDYVAMAVSRFGSLENAQALAVGAVATLRMTSGGTDSQPMLAFVPDGGATLLLLGLALSSLGACSRRFRA